MYKLSEKQIDYILNDIRRNGVEMEDLQLNLLDHVCCIIEQNLGEKDDFERFYHAAIKQFYKKELREIEEETVQLLTFKNYYAMRKFMLISGVFSAVAFILGSLFKLMHWPGASVLLVLGMGVLSFFFLPVMLLTKSRETGKANEKLVVVIGFLMGILHCLAVMFTIQHWPGSFMLWISEITLLLFVFTPLYFFNGIRQPDKRLNTMLVTVLLIAAGGLQFTLINLRNRDPQKDLHVYSYIQNEQLLQNMRPNTNNEMATAINNTCMHIKGLILKNEIGQTFLPADLDSRNIVIIERGLGNEFYDNGEGVRMLASLQSAVDKYNATQSKKLPIKHTVLDTDPHQVGMYSNLAVLNSITQLQMHLASR